MHIFDATIKTLSYKPSNLKIKNSKLITYPASSFNIQNVKSTGLIDFGEDSKLAYAQWVTPKRTRSYPFARIYDIYHFSGKVIAIIPIIKDEGLGQTKTSLIMTELIL